MASKCSVWVVTIDTSYTVVTHCVLKVASKRGFQMLKLLCSVWVVTIDTSYTVVTPSVQKVASIWS